MLDQINAREGKVSVIVATMATLNRAHLLKRAIESIRHSSTIPVKIIVVVNGSRHDIGLCRWLKDQADIHFEYLAAPSLPLALLKGRELVATEFFATLDDDDEYLGHAIDDRMRLIEAHSDIDLVVTNGYRNVGGVDNPAYKNLATTSEQPDRPVV